MTSGSASAAWPVQPFQAMSQQHQVHRPLVPGVSAPPSHRQARVWPHPVPPGPGMGAPMPLWWWLGAHGGAGVTTLTAMIAPSADSRRMWPSGLPEQSGAVVLVCRTHAEGLERARDLISQFTARMVPPSLRLLGLATVADAPGRLPKDLRRLRDLVSSGAQRAWHLPWVEEWRAARTPQLPAWHPSNAGAPAGGNGHGGTPALPPAYLDMAVELTRQTTIHQQF